eukprot:TRINITY_DN2017_c0_g1_i1.p1 TRINITY_DN2017_c0_g1~~TRINITY_DN2017_c0_g1_i1.p1  ORF type:complete len:110 (+),score=7.60 TRINITY_DN2017_c0_g1_i1:165-494(+)
MSSNSAVIMKASLKESKKYAEKMVERGFVASIIPQQPEDGLLRNRAISKLNRSSRNWRSGHSSLMLASELVTLLRRLGECAAREPYINDALTGSLAQLPALKNFLMVMD